MVNPTDIPFLDGSMKGFFVLRNLRNS